MKALLAALLLTTKSLPVILPEVMKALLAALLLTTGLLCPCAESQQDDDDRKEFLAIKAKAEQGNAIAQGSLGARYYIGLDVVKDYVEAVKWYRKAAEQGNANAQRMLGVAYANGKGVAKDYAEAYAWWNLASMSPFNEGKTSAEHRDELEKKMTPQQVADAQKRTKELRAIVEAKAKEAK